MGRWGEVRPSCNWRDVRSAERPLTDGGRPWRPPRLCVSCPPGRDAPPSLAPEGTPRIRHGEATAPSHSTHIHFPTRIHIESIWIAALRKRCHCNHNGGVYKSTGVSEPLFTKGNKVRHVCTSRHARRGGGTVRIRADHGSKNCGRDPIQLRVL